MEIFGNFFKNIGKIGSKKATTNQNQVEFIEQDNQLAKMMFEKMGMQTNLMPYEIKEYIRQGYIINPNVHSVINKIIRPAASVPFYLYEIKKDKKKEFERYKAAVKAGNLLDAEIYSRKSLEFVDDIPELTRLLTRPNEKQSFQEWIEQAMGFHLLTGEQFIYGLKPNGFDTFTKMYNMPPQLTVIELGDTFVNPIKGYYIDYLGLDKSEMIAPEDICHIKYMNPDYMDSNKGQRGLSPMSPLCKVITRSNDSLLAQLRIIQNGHPVGILTSASERGVTKEQISEAKKNFRAFYQGAINKNDIMMTAAQFQWLQLGMNNADMQLLEADKADLESVSRVYNVPLPLMLNDSSSWNSNMKEAKKAIWNDARLPLLDQQKSALNRFILPAYIKKYNRNLYFDYDLMAINDLKEDDKNVVDIIKIEIESGTLTPNEGRELRNRDRIENDPNADLLYIGNLKPLSLAMQENKQPKDDGK